MERLSQWLDEYFGTVVFVVFVGTLALALWSGYYTFQHQRACMAAGYVTYNTGFCVKRVNNSDVVVPYKQVAP